MRGGGAAPGREGAAGSGSGWTWDLGIGVAQTYQKAFRKIDAFLIIFAFILFSSHRFSISNYVGSFFAILCSSTFTVIYSSQGVGCNY